MFAVVEFDNRKKEFYVVPLIWLSDDKANCYWLKIIKGESQLSEMVQNMIPPEAAWKLYRIKKVHYTAENFNDANNNLLTILEQSSGSDSARNIIITTPSEEHLNKEQISENPDRNAAQDSCTEESSSEDEPLVGKLKPVKRVAITEGGKMKKKQKTKMSKSLQLQEKYSHGDESSDDPAEVLKGRMKKKATKPSLICSQLSSSPSLSNEDEERQVTPSLNCSRNHSTQSFIGLSGQTPSSSRYTPSMDSVNNIQATSFQEKIVKDLESLKAIQEQHTLILHEILSTVRTKNVQALTRPADTPDLPIDHKRDFMAFESWLENHTNFTYMRSRVAAVGGSTVRGATMNMMKFLVTNKIGMRFNWAGSAPKDERHQQKYPFKDTKMFILINDAVKLAFAGRESTVDLSDQVVIRAVQDWLKLSKSRYSYNNTTK